jgi:putative spermidine/putrescine transport system substrate-binding protein
MPAYRFSAALAACLSLVGLSAAHADDQKLVVTAYAGIWQQSIEKNFGTCYKETTGKDIAIQSGDPAAWLNKIRANPSRPPIDVVTLAPAETEQARRAGLLDTLNKAKLPNLAQIPASNYEVWGDQAVQVHTAALGVLYNKEAVPHPPKDWKTLFDDIAAGKFGKRVSMPAGTYTWGPDFIWFVGHTYGGDADVAFAKLKAMMPNVAKFWTTPAEATNLIGTKQVDVLLYWDGRSYDFIDKNSSWAAYYNPAPKSLGTSVSFAKVKNGNDAAWDFINCALSAKAQVGHAETLGYGITNSTVVYPDKLKGRITPASDMIFPPYAKLLDLAPQWIDRWNREMR